MTDRRIDHVTRKRVSEMSPDELRQALLFSETAGLPNRRAFDEGMVSPWVAICDANGLKTLNDKYGYSAGNTLIRMLAEALKNMGLDAYHDKGDEFLCKGESYGELNLKLSKARELLREQPFAVSALDGRTSKVSGGDFSYGIGPNLREAERALKHQKELSKVLKLLSGKVCAGEECR